MSPEREIVEKFKEAMETKTVDLVAHYMAEDATCEVLPSTVGRKFTGPQWITHITERANAAQSATFDIVNVIEHPLFAYFQANASIVFPSGDPFSQEMIFIFEYAKNADGSLRIVNVIEYIDSFKVKELMAKLTGGPPTS